jgi:hypothetical protein
LAAALRAGVSSLEDGVADALGDDADACCFSAPPRLRCSASRRRAARFASFLHPAPRSRRPATREQLPNHIVPFLLPACLRGRAGGFEVLAEAVERDAMMIATPMMISDLLSRCRM